MGLRLRRLAQRLLSQARGDGAGLGRRAVALMSVGLAVVACSGADGQDAVSSEVIDAILTERLGGDTTTLSDRRNAFGLSARNLDNDGRRLFEVGDSFFTQNWVSAPASTEARDGLGPVFNALSCSSCHGQDGRARPPSGPDDPERGLLLRLSVPSDLPESLKDGALPDPVYGGQLQDRAILGVDAEGKILIRYEEIPGQYADGTPYTLLRPSYEIIDLAFGDLAADVQISPRIAPAVFGLGLIEAIPEADILALADPEDIDGDGISGRPNRVWDIRAGDWRLGRFGWKAEQPTVEQQAAGAFLHDIGITSSLFPNENCNPAQQACAAAPNGGTPEISDERLTKVAFYNRTLAVPAMRDIDDPQVREGAELFFAASCALCHRPSFTTGDHEIAALRDQRIHPYTDLLLHDMGEGLADDRPVFTASGSEWRTPPLWGIGLVEVVNGHTRFLHDGRARNLEEAILWHGGEAERSREAFRNMTAEEREALLRFLRSL